MAAFAPGGSSPSGARCLLMPSQLRCSATRGGCCWPSTPAHQCRAWTDLRGGHQLVAATNLGTDRPIPKDRYSPEATGTVQSYANSIFPAARWAVPNRAVAKARALHLIRRVTQPHGSPPDQPTTGGCPHPVVFLRCRNELRESWH